MANERITESIVRRHFEGDAFIKDEKATLAEQSSDNPIIQKLLKNASKKGNNHGRPEFIIKYNDRNLLIVIECKADIKDQPQAESDAKHYAAYLSKEFDVIAIAVSGDKNNYKVKHFLYLRSTNTALDFLGDELLSLENYLDSLLKDNRKYNQDYQKLLEYSKELNETLHGKKYEIPEGLRALLVSGIIIGLQSNDFHIHGKDGGIKKSKILAQDLVKEISRNLNEANLGAEKVENLKKVYEFITTHRNLCEVENNLYDLIKEIDKNVNQFIKNYQYFDILGQFYIEFLRYANGDKALGIVLTPPHITEFFAEIAEVNKDSVVVDNCTGTGGFLISAMKKMIMDAKDNKNKIREIHKNQLVGIESQPHIFALAVSNMFIHGDGKSNIYPHSCFDKVGGQLLTEFIREKHAPNIGMLNPPYRTKKAGIQEWEFILNNLEMLSKGGKCVAIIPTSCVLAQSGEELELKNKLLNKHTLEAVFSMPDQLFYPIGVITSVVLITAHQPNKDSYTYLGYYKDDGFVMRRHRGRLDYYNRWKNLKEVWLAGYKSKQAKADFAEVKQLKGEDEWCAEAYMETDYSKLNQEDFEKTIRDYVGFKFLNKIE